MLLHHLFYNQFGTYCPPQNAAFSKWPLSQFNCQPLAYSNVLGFGFILYIHVVNTKPTALSTYITVMLQKAVE